MEVERFCQGNCLVGHQEGQEQEDLSVYHFLFLPDPKLTLELVH